MAIGTLVLSSRESSRPLNVALPSMRAIGARGDPRDTAISGPMCDRSRRQWWAARGSNPPLRASGEFPCAVRDFLSSAVSVPGSLSHSFPTVQATDHTADRLRHI